MNSINTSFMQQWSAAPGYVCPKCGSTDIEVDNTITLTSNPPQSQFRCKKCDHHFASGMQDIYRKPIIDDYTAGSMGWICPKCGTVLSPYVKECPHCAPTYGIIAHHNHATCNDNLTLTLTGYSNSDIPNTCHSETTTCTATCAHCDTK